jgi:hypothetical protein
MLTADGPAPKARAAAENEPRSITARNSSMLSLLKFTIYLSPKLKATDFFCHAY